MDLHNRSKQKPVGLLARTFHLLPAIALWGVLIFVYVGLAYGSLASLVRGVPPYDSLEVFYGTSTDVKPCSGKRNEKGALVHISNHTESRSYYLPCHIALEPFPAGSALTIRSRDERHELFFEPPQKAVWSVTRNDVEIYSYADRAKRHNSTKPLTYLTLVLSLAIPLVALGVGIKRCKRRRHLPQ